MVFKRKVAKHLLNSALVGGEVLGVANQVTKGEFMNIS